MKALRLLAQLRSRDIRLWCEGERLRFDAPAGALTDELRAEVAAQRGELLALLRRAGDEARPPLAPLPRGGELPLSFGQRRLWFLDQLRQGNLAYNVPVTVRLRGALDGGALRAALSALVARHETLRTSFPSRDGVPRAVVADDFALDYAEEQAVGDTAEARFDDAVQRARRAAVQPFDLARGPLVRVRLLRVDAADHVLQVTMHHIVSDGWSMAVLFRELSALYAAFVTGAPSPLPPLEIHYADYAAWQERCFAQDGHATELAYWLRQLREAPLLELPTDRPRPPVQTHRGAFLWLPFPAELAAQLRAVAEREDVTLFQLLLAAFQVLLARQSGQDDIVVGTPIAARGERRLEGLIGFFVDNLVLRGDLSGDPTFRELLRRARTTVLDAFAHQSVPFERLVDELQPERDLGRNPLFQVLFNHFNLTEVQHAFPPLELSVVDMTLDVAKFDLTLHCFEDGDVLVGKLEYATDLFDAATMRRWGEELLVLLRGIVADPGRPLSRLPLLTAAERRLLRERHGGEPGPAAPPALPELLARHAAATPDATAVACGEVRLSYAELRARAARLGARLRALGVGPEVRVGLWCERSAEAIVALHGVWAAGGAYVPLDPGAPPARAALLLEDSGAAVVVGDRALLARLPASGARVLCVDDLDLDGAPEDTALPRLDPRTLAYVIYTSGSTGRPKGVEVEHAQLARYTAAIAARLGAAPGTRFATVSTLAADLGNTAIFGALQSGGALYVVPEAAVGDADAFARYVQAHAIDVLKVVPSHLAALLGAAARPADVLPRRLLVLGGEACSWELVERVRALAPGCRVLNHYGPTETAVGVVTAALDPAAGARAPFGPPLGAPLAGTQVLLLDRRGAPAPLGAAGELCVGGAQVARGYTGDPALTAARFVPDPFATAPGARLYRTGDRARWAADGALVFGGRVDHQLKIRGFRVEPAEIEAALAEHAAVAACAVAARAGDDGRPQLVGWIVPRGTPPDHAQLRAFLREALPEPLVPALFEELDALPRTASGKIDRRALPEPRAAAAPGAAHVEPRTDEERTLARIWADVLRRPQVSVRDNFFELGGESILSIQIVSRANQAGLRLSPRDLFEHPTIEALARLARGPEVELAGGDEPTGAVPLTPIVHRFFEPELAEPQHYNHALLLVVPPGLDLAALALALADVVAHHDALRLRCRRQNGTWTQEIVPAERPALQRLDLADLPPAARPQALAQHAAALHASLDLEDGPVLRAAHLRLGGESDRLLLVVHHVAVDAVSWRLLVEDVESAYGQRAAGEPLALPRKTTSYRAWARRLAEHARAGGARADLDAWLRIAARALPPLPVDRDVAPETRTAARLRAVTARLGPDETRRLADAAARAYRATVQDVLLTALARSVRAWTGAALRVDLEAHGRRDDLLAGVDLARTVGWFTAVYPVLLELPPGDDLGAQLKAVKEQVRAAPSGGLSYGILRYLDAGDDPRLAALRAQPPSEIGFNYLGQQQGGAEHRLFRRAPEPTGAGTSPRNRRRYLIDVAAAIDDGGLRVDWIHDAETHEAATIERLAARFTGELRALLQHASRPGALGYTPSDFPHARLAPHELDALVARFGGALEDVYVLSPVQKGMVYHTLAEPGSPAYVTQLAFDIEGALDADAWRAAWQQVTDLHPVLRTAVVAEGLRELHQVVLRERGVRWRTLDLAGAPRARLDELCAEERAGGFDLADAPLMRFVLVRLGASLHRFVWTHHHLLLDGWSLPSLLEHVFACYRAASRGTRAAVDPGAPYRSYVGWLLRQDADAAAAHWQTALAGFAEPTPLPRAHRLRGRPAQPRIQARAVAAETTAALHALARAEHLTLNTLVQGAWALLLGRWSGRREVTFGVTVSGRPAELPGVEAMLGLFINTLPLRVQVGDAPLLPWLHAIQQQQLGMQPFEHTPLYEIQRLVAGRGALFESILVFENMPVEPASPEQRGGLHLRHHESFSFADYPLAAVVLPRGAQLRLELRYDAACFADETMQRWLRHFETLLASIAAAPAARTDALPMLGADEEEQQLRAWNATARPFPREPGVHELFAAQAARTPDAPAVVHGGRTLGYRALDADASRLARVLRAHGAARGTRVALCLERGPTLITAMLAVLKSGAAYVPLDPEHPTARLAAMLDDARPAVLVTEPRTAAALAAFAGPVVDLVRDAAAIAAASAEPLPAAAGGSDPAYLIYTSGSTGRPKGVVVPHAAIARLVRDTDYVTLGPGDRIAQASNASFDAATFEVFGALLNGACLVGLERDCLLAPARFGAAIAERGVTVLFVTTALFHELAAELPAMFAPLRCLLFGGEAVDPARVRAVLRAGPPRRLLHVYGPTENTTFSTWHEVTAVPEDAATVPIGRPIANTTCFVLDDALRPVPAGAPGELYLGGAGLALGYAGDPALTAARFVPHPYGAAGARLYRTGDVVRARPDGALLFEGRRDGQVKLRGFRIEIGEIEAALRACAGVRDAAVVCREDGAEKQLVGYVVPAPGAPAPEPARLRASLRTQLPDYMVPAALVPLAALPRTPHGKIDRAALPAPEAGRGDGAFVAPRGALEERIAALWREVLELPQVSVHDNFFDLGGHSLKLLRLHARLGEELGATLAITDLFVHPTVAALAAHLSGGGEKSTLRQAAETRIGARDGVGDAAIAVLALAGRFPGAASVETLWQNLRAGVESVRFFGDDELRAAGVPDALLRDPRYVKARAVLDGVELFDGAFFGYSPRECELLDPQQRVFLECCHEALERAGYDPRRYGGLIGIWAGASTSTYADHVRARPDLLAALGGLQAILGTDPGFLTARVSYELDLRGPSVAVQTACSTSLVAVHEACRALLDRQCDIALAGGVSITPPQARGQLHTPEGIHSPDGHNRTFDARAQGTVSGQGAAVVVLKRLRDALGDGDPIQAVILGTGVSNDGRDRVGFTAPGVDGQARAIALAHAAAGVDPQTIGYVEAHGTATPLGDPIEVAALTRVFRERTRATGFCALGSLKSNMGHLNDAAGAAGLIKVVLALQHRALPPSLHFEKPNPQIDFAGSPFFVPTGLLEWEARNGAPRRAGVSSFGLGGTNAHAVVEEAPARAPLPSSRLWHVLPLAAKTAGALARQAQLLADHLDAHPEDALADVAWTLQVGRAEHAHRRAVWGRTPAEAAAALRGEQPERAFAACAEEKAPAVAFLFPGQGAQYVGMTRALYESEPAYRAALEPCCALLQPHVGLDLRALLFAEPSEAAAALLRRTEHAQPALFAVGYALAKLWEAHGVEPDAMLGHSVGELVAACVAGVFELEAACELVAQRGRLLGSLPPGGAMLSVPLGEAELAPALGGALSIAAVNAPELCVVSGADAAIARLEQKLTARGVRTRRLHTSHAFHSALVEPIVEPFGALVARLGPRAPQRPFVSSTSGDWITEAEATDAAYWARHLRAPVRFADAVRMLAADGAHLLLEVGPGRTLSALARPCVPQAAVVAAGCHPHDGGDEQAALAGATAALWAHGVRPDWARWQRGEPRRRVLLPTYPFERQRYWVEPRPPAARARRADIGDWFWAPAWRRAALPAAAPAPADARWLVFADETPFAAALCGALARRGPVITVRAAEAFARTADGYAVDPGSVADWGELVRRLEQTGGVPPRLVHAWLAAPCDDEDRALARGALSVLQLMRAVGEAEIARPLELALVTSAVHDVTGDESLSPAKAAVLGPCRVVPLEFPNVRCRQIDVEAASVASAGAAALAQLVRELETRARETVVCHRGGKRWIEAYAPLHLEAPAAALPRRLRRGATYLVTGGLSGVGLVLATYLARAAAAKLVVTGRTPLPERARWADVLAHGNGDPAAARVRALQQLEQAGAEVMAVQADASDLAAMRAAVAEAERRFGPIAGVVHAAGGPAGGPIVRQDPQHARHGFAPKIGGARVLHALFGARPLDFVVLCSSLNAVKPAPGVADYAAANAYLDAFARAHAAASGTYTVALAWNRWREVGMAARAHGAPLPAQHGISNDEGVEVFRRVLDQAEEPRLLVSEVDLPALLRAAVRGGDAAGAPPPPGEDGGATSSPAHPRPALGTDYVAPRDALERELVAVWELLFGIGGIGVHDSFFALGGHSLLATRLLDRLARRWPEAGLTLRALFRHPTVAQLAQRIAAAPARAADDEPLAPVREADPDVAQLSDDQVDAMLARLLAERGEAPGAEPREGVGDEHV